MSGYSDGAFESVTDEIEELLGDLMGVEAAAKAMQQFIAGLADGDENVAPAPKELTIPAAKSFTVHPTLPMEEAVDMGSFGGYQAWVDECFEIGKGGAAGTAAWLRGLIAQHFYGVDAQAIIAGAANQQSVLTDAAGTLVEGFHDIQVLLDNHWAGGAADSFESWLGQVSFVEEAIFKCADAAQISAGATGDIIAATQQALLAQAEKCRTALDDALGTWREDSDVFPFPPGSGYKITELILEARDKVTTYADKIPGGGEVLAAVAAKAVGKSAPLKIAAFAFTILQEAEARDSDPATPATAQEIIDHCENAMRDMTKEARDAMDVVNAPLEQLLGKIQGTGALTLAELPDKPGGVYDRDGHNYGYTPPS